MIAVSPPELEELLELDELLELEELLDELLDELELDELLDELELEELLAATGLYEHQVELTGAPVKFASVQAKLPVSVL